MKDFVLWLFQLAWNGFSDGRNAVSTYANIIRDWDDWYKTVSYTHLDVYKRQALRMIL